MGSPMVTLKKGREKSLLRRHPWVFEGAVAKVAGHPESGQTVDVISAEGRFLGQGAWSPSSQIRVRMWTFHPAETVDEAFLHRRLAVAIRQRATMGTEPLGCRLVHAEADGLPGLIVDRYAGFLVIQALSAGAEFWKPVIVDLLAELVPCRGIFERSDAGVRFKEGLAPQRGILIGQGPPALVEIAEGPCRFGVDIANGHKTGFYLDQRDNRRAVAALSAGKTVLNAFAYTGAFTVACLAAGAVRVTNVDSSGPALALALDQLSRNGLAQNQVETVNGDVLAVLRHFCEEGRRFDLVILDPPKFVESRSHLNKAARGYKDINRLGFKLLGEGGRLATFSCSGLMPPDLFQKIVADAALDAGATAQIVGRLGPPPDHPVAFNFPEGDYLKGLICRVTGD